MADLHPGDLVAGRYRIERPLGVGGMGAVYEARDTTTAQRFAVKVLHAELQRHPIIPQRFVQEAMAARALSTPHAVKVEGTGNLPDGCPFIVMEFLDGEDLGTLTKRAGGRLPVGRALALINQVALALEEAHARGIVHRDLKPENVFVIPTPAGEHVKVVDFGISKILTRDDGVKLTQTGTTLGTPQYMPMEQLRGAKDLDGRVDVYAVGVILYEVFAGTRPFDGFTYEEVIVKAATTVPAPLSSLRADIPQGLSDLIARAMAREREARVGSMTELRASLAAFAGGDGVAPHPISNAPPRWSAPAKPKRSKLMLPLLIVGLLAMGMLVLFAVGGTGAWYFLSDGSAAASARPANPTLSGTTSGKKQTRGAR